ncbi:MAG: alpha/beta hydrolase, partial [Marinilabiliales bacterium]
MGKFLMKKHLVVQNNKICYTDTGNGPVIVLLHGYLESIDIWEGFATELSKTHQVICFDIPGHGNSDILAEKHSMKEISVMIAESLKILGIKKCFMIGHSMGGYVTLMFHEL